MTIRPLLCYPNPGLRQLAGTVQDFGPALQTLAADLLDTLRAASGIGITAPHIGVSLRLVVLHLPEDVVRTYVNPEILWVSEVFTRTQEGSIAMPGVAEEVERNKAIKLRYYDLGGIERQEAAEGLLATCHQHEIDQLDGIFWIQRLSRLRRDRLLKRYSKQHVVR